MGSRLSATSRLSLTPDVGLKYMRSISLILLLTCLWTSGCSTALPEQERLRLSELLVEEHISDFYSSFPRFKTNQNVYVAIGLTPDRKWIPPSADLIKRIQKQGISVASIQEADTQSIPITRGVIFFSDIEWNSTHNRYDWTTGRATSPDNRLSGSSGYLTRGIYKWNPQYTGGWTQ